MLLRVWKRATLLTLAAGVMFAWLSLPCPAQERLGPDWRISTGVFAPFDIPSNVAADAGITLATEYAFSVDPEGARQWSGVFRYATYTLGGGQRIRLYSPTIELRQYLRSSAHVNPFDGWWIGSGLGMVFGDNSAGGHVWHFAYTVAAGYDFQSYFLEARMFRGTKRGDHGFIASIGLRW